MYLRSPTSRAPERRGVVLLTVLVVVVILMLAAYQYSELMMAEYTATVSYTRAVQARALAESGINYAAMLVSDKNSLEGALGGNPYDNGRCFREVHVSGDGKRGSPRGYFSIVAPAMDGSGYRWGLTDEAGKININALVQLDSSGDLAANTLTALGLDPAIADAIIDWIDADDKPRPKGAESIDYAGEGFSPRNGPLETLGELLYVKGMTPELLYGNDTNLNGILDRADGESGSDIDLGLQAFITVYSREQNVDSEGKKRLWINTAGTLALYSKLEKAVGIEMTNYILAYRRYGPAPEQLPQGVRIEDVQAKDLQRQDLDLRLFQTGGRQIRSIAQLINTTVLITNNRVPNSPAKRVPCPLNDEQAQRELLPALYEKLTTLYTSSEEADIPARVNVNTAPLEVLEALPGITPDEADKIFHGRPDMASFGGLDKIYQTPAWLLTEAGVRPQTLDTLERFITTRTQVYRVQSVGHFEGGGPTARVEAVIDTNRGRPRIVYWRDLSELGKGFDFADTRGMR